MISRGSGQKSDWPHLCKIGSRTRQPINTSNGIAHSKCDLTLRRMGLGEGSYSFCTSTASIGPTPGRSWLEGAVKHELNLDVVHPIRIIGSFRRPSAPGPQMAREKQLRPDHPTIFKGSPHRLRIWGDNKHNILQNSISHGYPLFNFLMIRISLVYP